MLLLLLIFINVLPMLSYTEYTKQQTQEIQTRQRQQWNSISINQSTTQSMSFILKRRMDFFTKPLLYPKNIKMRGKVYFMDDYRKFIAQEFLSPFDVTRVYVHSQQGLIVKSQQFYQLFAFEVSMKQDQKYQIVFEDGPPGPLKLIHIQIDYSSIISSTNKTTSTNSETKTISSRLGQIQSIFHQASQYITLSKIQQNAINESMMKNSQYYSVYIIVQIILIIFLTLIQATIVRKQLLYQYDHNVI